MEAKSQSGTEADADDEEVRASVHVDLSGSPNSFQEHMGTNIADKRVSKCRCQLVKG
jgi:hypothetical protein